MVFFLNSGKTPSVVGLKRVAFILGKSAKFAKKNFAKSKVFFKMEKVSAD